MEAAPLFTIRPVDPLPTAFHENNSTMMTADPHINLTNKELSKEVDLTRKELARQSFRDRSKRDSILGNKSSILGFEVPFWRNGHKTFEGIATEHCDASDLKTNEHTGFTARRSSQNLRLEQALGLGDSLVCLGFDSGGNPDREREPTWKVLEHMLVIVFPLLFVAVVIPIVVYIIVPSWTPIGAVTDGSSPSVNATFAADTLDANGTIVNDTSVRPFANTGDTHQLRGDDLAKINATSSSEEASGYPLGFTDAEKIRWDEIKALISQQQLSLPDDFTNPHSSAYHALDWIVTFDVTGEDGLEFKISTEDSILSKEDAAEIHLIEKYALAVFFFATHPHASPHTPAAAPPDLWTPIIIDWVHDASESVCQWEGVQCGEFHRVGNLHLSHKSLSGTLPRELVGLFHLKNVDLSFNEIGGTLPSEWNQLSHLRHLFLGSNKLEGTVPSSWESMRTHLAKLDLSENKDIIGTTVLP